MPPKRTELLLCFDSLQYFSDNQITESRIAVSHDLLQ
jgi:hypothetical protein